MTKKSLFNRSYVGPRKDILDLVPTYSKKVLDMGCSIGVLGESIKKKTGAVVYGVEISKEMAAIASRKIDKVIVGDLEDPVVLKKLKGVKFDVIIFADVLEHLRDPWSLLNNLYELLTPRGLIIASIPNVRHLDTILNLVFRGYWPYRERGIHDKTHLRFFAYRNINEMFNDANLEIEKTEVHFRLIESPHFLNKYAKYLAIPILKDFLAFQYLIVAHKK